MQERSCVAFTTSTRYPVVRRNKVVVLGWLIFLAIGFPGSGELARASIPAPRETGDYKSVKIVKAESLPWEQRVIHLPKGKSFPDHLKFGTYWQEPVLCGPNALYVLAQLSGLHVTREQVAQLVPITPTGSNLADLSRAAKKLGLSHEIRKVSQAELFRLSPPFLVHEEIRSSDPEVRDTGHFFVVVRFNDRGQIGIIDGVSGLYQFIETARFERSFSGYVLVPELYMLGVPIRWAWATLYGLAAVVVVLSCLLLYVKRPTRLSGSPSLSHVPSEGAERGDE